MKILFSADWHIKLGQKNVPVEWQANRFRSFFKKLNDLEPVVDMQIIAGDIFDKVPNLQELELFFEFLANNKIPGYIIDGNHEATKSGKTFFTHLRHVVDNLSRGLLTVIDEAISLDGIDYLPYCKLKSDITNNKLSSDILVTHVRGEIPPHVKSEVNLDLFNRWKVVLAGDLHSYSNSQRNILYPGSPMTTTFHRNKVSNGIIIFETDDLSHEWIELGLPQMIRKTVTDKQEIVPTDYDLTIYTLEGDVKYLSDVVDDTLIDKKVVNRSSEAKLSLANMTTVQELGEYLNKIVNLSDEDIHDVIGVFNDYSSTNEME